MLNFHNKNIHFVSLGCPKNLVDSEVMLGVLTQANYRITTKPEEAGVIVVNTCGFIEASKQESIDTILEMADYKKSGDCHTLVMTGCLVQRYAEPMRTELPEVDLFIGTGQYHQIAEYLTARRISPDEPLHLTTPTYIHSHDTPRLLAGNASSAFLKVAEGCKKRCSFCIIPKMRGDLRSRSIESLRIEAENLVRQGTRELCLVAQDLTDYGLDFKDRHALVTLLQTLTPIQDLEWIRLFYSYPDGISDELIQLMKSEPKICRYLDMPLQHTNNTVLKRMNRAITHEKMTALISRLRHEIPDISIRTSFIVGFPGETEAQFLELMDFIRWARLDHVGVFKYSREEGTPSHDLDGQLPEEVKLERLAHAQQTLEEIANENARAQVGKTFRAMIDGVHPDSDDFLIARSHRQAKDIDTHIIVNDGMESQKWLPGQFARVTITDTAGPDLVGRIDQFG